MLYLSENQTYSDGSIRIPSSHYMTRTQIISLSKQSLPSIFLSHVPFVVKYYQDNFFFFLFYFSFLEAWETHSCYKKNLSKAFFLQENGTACAICTKNFLLKLQWLPWFRGNASALHHGDHGSNPGCPHTTLFDLISTAVILFLLMLFLML